MRHVAERAGVGVGTVSRVVNGAASVSELMIARVQKAIDELGFQRDEIARSLHPGQNSLTIGLLLGDLTNPFYATLAKGAVEFAKRAGYAVVVSMADEDPALERRAVDELLGRRVAGLIIVPDRGDHSFLDHANRFAHVPIVFVDRPARGARADVVLFDNEEGGRMATGQLIAHGHRRIATLIAPSHYTTGRRLRGYRKALREAGIAVDERLVVTLREGSVQAAEAATRELMALADQPTAIFSTTSFLTEGIMRAFRPRHLGVALVGFDDFRFADMLPTPITVIASDVEELGRQATRRLLARINGDASPLKRIVLPVTLIARGSGEIPVAALPVCHTRPAVR
jgi:LacI family transcriptional regulator